MKNKIIFFLLLSLFSVSSPCQEKMKDKGNINLHVGSMLLYNTYSVGYESFNLIPNLEKHSIKSVVRFGGWNANVLNKNVGALSSFGLVYLFGKGSHKLEHSSEFVTHFDKGLKGQKITYVGGLYRLFLGYRFQPVDKKIILRFGLGWREVFQFGLGYRF